MRKLILMCITAGIGVPCAFALMWHWFETPGMLSDGAQRVLVKVQLILWPSSVMMMPATDPNNPQLYWTAFTLSVAANVLLYVVLGILVWLGVTRNRWYLLPAIAGLAVLWWRLLSTFR
jgi:hypothetical protein